MVDHSWISNHSNTLRANTTLGQNSFCTKLSDYSLSGRSAHSLCLILHKGGMRSHQSKWFIVKNRKHLTQAQMVSIKKNWLDTAAAVITSLPTTATWLLQTRFFLSQQDKIKPLFFLSFFVLGGQFWLHGPPKWGRYRGTFFNFTLKNPTKLSQKGCLYKNTRSWKKLLWDVL